MTTLLSEQTISVGTTARLLNISERTVRYYCDVGELKAYKLGKRWRIIRSSIDDLLTRRSNVGITESAITAITASQPEKEVVRK